MAFATGALYLVVGRLILRRNSLTPEAQAANSLFATWWVSLAILYLASGPWNIAVGLGWRDLALTVAFINALLIVICFALWGILGFLLYVYTGTNRWAIPTAVFYAGLAFGLLWLMAWMEPTGFAEETGSSLAYSRRMGTSSSMIVGLMFSVPIFLAAIAYSTLIFRVKEAGPRYRIGMVGGAFAFQFGWSIVSSLLGLSRRFPDSRVLLIVNQGVAILVPLLIVMAYRPPKWIASRLHRQAEA